MNSLAVFAILGAAFFILEAVFFMYCFRWLSSGKRLREKEFARLDTERAELLELQSNLVQDLTAAKQLSSDAVQKLSHLGAEAHAEWTEMAHKVESLMGTLEAHIKQLTTEQLQQIAKSRMAVDKSIKDSNAVNTQLTETLKNAQRILKFYDKNVPTEQIIKDLQTEKYSEAKRLLEQGSDASQIAKKLGLPLSEVSLIASFK